MGSKKQSLPRRKQLKKKRNDVIKYNKIKF